VFVVPLPKAMAFCFGFVCGRTCHKYFDSSDFDSGTRVRFVQAMVSMKSAMM
jgi:hypothetical protein